MKSTQSKNNSRSATYHSPFFQKENTNNFFGKSDKTKQFFNSNPIQAKLAIGQPNDIYENEADSMVDNVVQRSTSKSFSSKENSSKSFFTKSFTAVQRKCTACEQEEKLQKKSVPSSQTASANIESSLSSSKGSGSLLPHDTREQMESSFSADFSGVRIHNNSSSEQMNKDLHAQAFTSGSDIYINSGKYNTDSQAGKHLLAHELSHVIQQNNNVLNKNTVQRQPDKVDNTVKEQAPWENAFLAIFIEDKLHCKRDEKSKIVECNHGYANAYGNKSLSSNGPIKTCTEPATFFFNVSFVVDALSAPRPKPFTEPFLKVNLDFVPNGKKTPAFSLHKSGQGRYAGDGKPLEVSWFPNFIFNAKEDGVVIVELEMNDPDTGIIIKYVDKIICELFPCT